MGAPMQQQQRPNPNQQQQQNQYQNPNQQQNMQQNFQNFNNTSDTTDQFDPADIQQNKMIALLSYLGILFLVPLLAAPNSRFARFHANQGLVLFIVEIVGSIAISILSGIFAFIWILWFIIPILWAVYGIGVFVLFILGIVNATGGKAKELPLVGKIKILK